MTSDRASDFCFVVVREMTASPDRIFDAWVRRFDTWFAEPGAISMREDLVPFWFSTLHQGVHYSHYGRFLALEEPHLIEMTWVTGRNGTEGAETLVRVELAVSASGTTLTLRHGGFYDEAAATRHRESWPAILEHLDRTLGSGGPTISA